MSKKLTPHQQYLRSIPEAHVQRVICEALHVHGYLWHHEHDSRLSNAGVPDVIAVHPKTHVLLAFEFKTELGTLRPAQRQWADALSGSCIAYAVVRPRDIDAALVVVRIGASERAKAQR